MAESGRHCRACGTLLSQHVGPFGKNRCRHVQNMASSGNIGQPQESWTDNSPLSNRSQRNGAVTSSSPSHASQNGYMEPYVEPSQAPRMQQEQQHSYSQVSATTSSTVSQTFANNGATVSTSNYHGFPQTYTHRVTVTQPCYIPRTVPVISCQVSTSVSSSSAFTSGLNRQYSGTNHIMTNAVSAPRISTYQPYTTVNSSTSNGNGWQGYNVNSSMTSGYYANQGSNNSAYYANDPSLMLTLLQRMENLSAAVQELQIRGSSAAGAPIPSHIPAQVPPMVDSRAMSPGLAGRQFQGAMQSNMATMVQTPYLPPAGLGHPSHSNPMEAPLLPPSGHFDGTAFNSTAVSPQLQGNLVDVPGTNGRDLSNMEPLPSLQRTETWGNLPPKTLKTALRGECISLEDLSDSNMTHEPVQVETYMDSDFNVTHKTTSNKGKKSIDNIVKWLEAWTVYEQILVSHFGLAMFKEMSEYKRFILEQEKKYVFSAVYAYDSRHRAALSSKSLRFTQINATLMHQCFEAISSKMSLVNEKRVEKQGDSEPQPFQPPPSAEAKTSKKPKSKSVCLKFNDLLCNDISCTRRHICRGCRGEKPYLTCIKTGKCASRYQQENQVLAQSSQSSQRQSQSK